MNNTAMRVTAGVFLLLAGLAVGWFGHKAMSDKSNVATVSLYNDWRLACPPTSQKDGSCELQQDVLDSKTHNELARLSIFRLKDDTTLVITVPYNVLLEPGLGLGFDKDKPQIYQYETCNGVGCIVRIKLDDALRSSIMKTKEARILFAGLDGKPVGLPFSINGFDEASAAFDSAEAQRRSWWRRLWS